MYQTLTLSDTALKSLHKFPYCIHTHTHMLSPQGKCYYIPRSMKKLSSSNLLKVTLVHSNGARI